MIYKTWAQIMPLPFIKFWNSFYQMCTIKSIGKCVKNYQRMRFKQNIKYLLRSKITEIMPLTWNYASAPHPPPENYSTANVWKLRPPPLQKIILDLRLNHLWYTIKMYKNGLQNVFIVSWRSGIKVTFVVQNQNTFKS